MNVFAVNYKIQILSLCFCDGFVKTSKQENCKVRVKNTIKETHS